LTILQTHLFYVDKTNILRELIEYSSNNWTVGPLGDLNLLAPSEHPGLAVCSNSRWFKSNNVGGLRLFYGAAKTTSIGYVQEVGWGWGDSKWQTQYAFPNSKASGGLVCTISDSPAGSANSTLNVWLQNAADGVLQQWWVNFNKSETSTKAAPVLTWMPALKYTATRLSSALAAVIENNNDTQQIFFRPNDTSTSISVLHLLGTAQKATSAGATALAYAGKSNTIASAMDGTSISSVLTDSQLHIFFQDAGNSSEIVEIVRVCPVCT
jgi:hypothetical protein